MRIHAVLVLREVGRLRRQAMRRRRIGHVAQASEAPAGSPRPHDVLADQPIRRGRSLPGLPLAEHRPKAIRQAFVEAAGLVLIAQLQGVLGDTMGQLVANHIIAAGEIDEDVAVAIAVDHLAAVPERVIVIGAVVHRRQQRHARAIDRIAPEGCRVERRDLPGGGERLLDRCIRRGSGVGNRQAGQRLAVVQVIDQDAGRCGQAYRQTRLAMNLGREIARFVAHAAKRPVDAQCGAEVGAHGVRQRAILGQLFQDAFGNDVAMAEIHNSLQGWLRA